jgi:hypothetical protein
MPKHIPLYEEFEQDRGQFQNYTAYDSSALQQVQAQKHVDIRDFAGSIYGPLTVFLMDFETMDELDDLTMEDLGGDTIIVPAESWTVGTIGVSGSGHHNIEVDCSVGQTITVSVGGPLDLETDFDDDDFISVALPNFPLTRIDIVNSYIDFSSNPTGDFETGPTASIALNQSEVALVEGDSELRFERSLISAIDLESVTSVRFRFEATMDTTVTIMAIRLLSKDWTYRPIDMNTLREQLVYPVSLNGGSASFDGDWPILFKADNPSSSADPAPIDLTTYVGIYTGSSAETEFNYVDLYYREKALDYIIQLELEGTEQDDLNGNPQPDFGEAEFSPRTQNTIENSLQGNLDGEHQFTLERVPDSLSSAFIKVHIAWNVDMKYIEISDSESLAPPYHFDIDIEEFEYLDVGVELFERSLHIQAWETDAFGKRTAKLLDELLVNPQIFKRRKGRFGWDARFADGDALVTRIGTGHQNFGEYRTQPYGSITPIEGAALNVGGTDTTDLFLGIFDGPWGGFFVSNPDRGPESFAIQSKVAAPLQGIQTNAFYIDDFDNIEISFQIYVLQKALDEGVIEIFLWDGFQPVPLTHAQLIGDTWQDMVIDLKKMQETYPPGYYRLVIVQTLPGQVLDRLNEWYVDKIHILRKTIVWEGRAYHDDAWGTYQGWIPFKGALNEDSGGVLFPERSNKLQVRAKTLREDAIIGQVRTTPKYAELGRFTWPDQKTKHHRPAVDIESLLDDDSTRTVILTGNASDSDGYIVTYHWDMGDGTKLTGKTITHTYELPGKYSIQLIVIDNNGESATDTFLAFD